MPAINLKRRLVFSSTHTKWPRKFQETEKTLTWPLTTAPLGYRDHQRNFKSMPYTLSNTNDTPHCQIHAVKFLASKVKYSEMRSKTTGWTAEKTFYCNTQRCADGLRDSSERAGLWMCSLGKSGPSGLNCSWVQRSHFQVFCVLSLNRCSPSRSHQGFALRLFFKS